MGFRFERWCFVLIALIMVLGNAGAHAADARTAIFAGGCFWCMEPPYDKENGVLETISGYANGNIPNPTYEQVSRGGTGYVEAVQITYDAEITSYEDLLEIYWPNVDPLDGDGQFCDQGDSYRPAIFYADEAQRVAAEASKRIVSDAYELDGSAVSIEELTSFYPAEDYHQNYYQMNPIRYNYYRWGCGRDARLNELWGDTERANLFN